MKPDIEIQLEKDFKNKDFTDELCRLKEQFTYFDMMQFALTMMIKQNEA